MARKKGDVNRLTKTVKEAVEFAFTKVNEENYLIWLSREHPNAFVSLVSKCIPQQATLSVQNTVIDLAAMMEQANINADRLARLNAPDTVEHVQHDTVIVEQVVSDIQPVDINPMKSKT